MRAELERGLTEESKISPYIQYCSEYSSMLITEYITMYSLPSVAIIIYSTHSDVVNIVCDVLRQVHWHVHHFTKLRDTLIGRLVGPDQGGGGVPR